MPVSLLLPEGEATEGVSPKNLAKGIDFCRQIQSIPFFIFVIQGTKMKIFSLSPDEIRTFVLPCRASRFDKQFCISAHSMDRLESWTSAVSSEVVCEWTETHVGFRSQAAKHLVIGLEPHPGKWFLPNISSYTHIYLDKPMEFAASIASKSGFTEAEAVDKSIRIGKSEWPCDVGKWPCRAKVDTERLFHAISDCLSVSELDLIKISISSEKHPLIISSQEPKKALFCSSQIRNLW